VDWGTIWAIVRGAAVSLVSTIGLRRWEWRQAQRVTIHMKDLPAVRKEISRLQIGADDPIVDPGQVAPATAHDRFTTASIAGKRDRAFAAGIVEMANEIGAICARCNWHGTPQPTLDERRVHGPDQQDAVARLSEMTAAYEVWLERRLRLGRVGGVADAMLVAGAVPSRLRSALWAATLALPLSDA
jgi:hypothetical protein